MTNLFRKSPESQKLLISIDSNINTGDPEQAKLLPRLAIDKFHCCVPTEWRLIRKSATILDPPVATSEDPRLSSDRLDNSTFVNDPPDYENGPHCAQESYTPFYGDIIRRNEADNFKGDKYRLLVQVPRIIKTGDVTKEFQDPVDNDGKRYWYVWPNDDDGTKMYLELMLLAPPCFPENRSPPAQNGIKKTCIRISPDYINSGNNRMVPNNKATYVYTVEKTVDSGGTISENSDSNCSGNNNLQCKFIKSKIKEYDIIRTEFECKAVDLYSYIGNNNDGNTITSAGTVICPQDITGTNPGDSGNTPSSSGNIYSETQWFDEYSLEVKVYDNWIHVDSIYAKNASTPSPYWNAPYTIRCWSSGNPPSNYFFTISNPPGETFCFDEDAPLGQSYDPLSADDPATNFLSDPPPPKLPE